MAGADAARQARLVQLLGVVLVLVGLWMLGANEYAAIAWHRGMARPGGNVLVLGPDARPGAGQYGQRVLVSGTPRVVEAPRDRDFGVQADTPLLVRKVAMFQWHEVRVGGMVSYQQDWIDHAVDSGHFDHPAGHANRQAFPFAGQRFEAPQVRLHGYLLAPAIVRALPGSMEPLVPDVSQLPANLQASFQLRDGALTTSANPQHPQLGDLRLSWQMRPLQTVTLVARVDGDQLVPAKGPGQGFEVEIGARSLTDVFADLPLPLRGVWAWRAGALVLGWLGAWLVLLRWIAPRTALLVAFTLSLTLLGILAGIMWVATAWAATLAAWVIAIFAALATWHSWRRLA